MLQVNPQTRSAIAGLIVIVLGGGWAAYGLLGGDKTFLTIMVILSIVLVGGSVALLGPRRSR